MKFIVIGSVKKDGKWMEHGAPVDLSPDEAKHIDPDGTHLTTEDVAAAAKLKSEAEKKLSEAKAAKPAPTHKQSEKGK